MITEPHSKEAEQSVLGSMLISQECAIEASNKISERDFYFKTNQIVFRTIKELVINDESIDYLSVMNKLEINKLLNKVGGITYLTELTESIPTTANFKQYLSIVKKKSIHRQIIKAGTIIAKLGYKEDEDITSILGEVEKIIYGLGETGKKQEVFNLVEVMLERIPEFEKRYKNESVTTGISTGFYDLDAMTGGLHDEELIVVAARPGMGKSALAEDLAINIAGKGNDVLIFSLEMSKEQIADKAFSKIGHVDSYEIRTGDFEETKWGNILGAANKAKNLKGNILVNDDSEVTVMDIRSIARKIKKQYNLGLIIVDYLQLMEGITEDNESENRQNQVAKVSRGLKKMARELKVPVIALSQVSRKCEYRQNKRPTLADLKESGAIEQDADMVMFIYRDDYYNPETDKKNIAEIIIAKQRHGPTGTIELGWLGDYVKFINLVRMEQSL